MGIQQSGVTGLAIAVVFAVTANASAEVLQVSAGGAISPVLSQAKPGDRVELAAGGYTEDLDITSSGTATEPIVVSGVGATLTGQVRIQGDYWRIEDLAISGPSSSDTIRIDGNNNMLIRIDASGGGRDGIDGGGKGNQVLDSKLSGFDTGTPGNDAHCIVLNPGAEDWIIRGNRIFDCSGDGIQLFSSGVARSIKNILIENNVIYYDGSTGVTYTENAIDIKNGDGIRILNNDMYGFSTNKIIVVQKGPSNLEIRCNSLHDSERGPEFRGEDGGTVENLTFANNLVYGMASYALKLDGVVGADVFNNTIADSSGDGLRIEGDGAMSGAVRNNLWIRTGKVESSGLVADHNGFFNASSQITSASDVTSDPLVDASYVPGSTSPLIDAGVDVGYAFAGAAPDIGYFELGGEVCSPGAAGSGGTGGAGGAAAGGSSSGAGGGSAAGAGGMSSGGASGGSAGSGGTSVGGASAGGTTGGSDGSGTSADDGGCGCSQVGTKRSAWRRLATALAAAPFGR